MIGKKKTREKRSKEGKEQVNEKTKVKRDESASEIKKHVRGKSNKA